MSCTVCHKSKEEHSQEQWKRHREYSMSRIKIWISGFVTGASIIALLFSIIPWLK